MKMTKLTGRYLPSLFALIGIAMVVTASVGYVVWNQSQNVAVEKMVTVVSNLHGITVIQNTSQYFTVTVSNPEDNPTVNVTLSVEVIGGSGVSAIITSGTYHNLAEDEIYVFHVTVSATALAEGPVTVNYSISQVNVA